MKYFLQRVAIFGVILFFLNIIFGELLLWKKRSLILEEKFYPVLSIIKFEDLPVNNIDVLYMGSSRAYSSFIPEMFDSISGLKSYNLGTSGQSPITSYFLLKEVFKIQNPKIIFYDISHEIYSTDDEIITGSYVFDYYSWNLNKFSYWIYGLNFKDKIAFFIPSYRFRNNIYWLIRVKLFGGKNNFDTNQYWGGKGYIGSTAILSKDDLLKPSIYSFSKEEINRKRIRFLTRIIDYVNNTDAELVFIYNPYPNIVLNNMIDREKIFSFYEVLISDYGLTYINLNTLMQNLCDSTDFRNMNHLNDYGARKATQFLYNKAIVEKTN
jgi:hypothetical protein